MEDVAFSLLMAVLMGWMAIRDSGPIGKWMLFGIATVSLLIAFIHFTALVAKK